MQALRGEEVLRLSKSVSGLRTLFSFKSLHTLPVHGRRYWLAQNSTRETLSLQIRPKSLFFQCNVALRRPLQRSETKSLVYPLPVSFPLPHGLSHGLRTVCPSRAKLAARRTAPATTAVDRIWTRSEVDALLTSCTRLNSTAQNPPRRHPL